jgi:hypothetical protein
MRKLRTIRKPLNPVQLFFISRDFCNLMVKFNVAMICAQTLLAFTL